VTSRSRDYPRGAASAPLLLVLAALAAAVPRAFAVTSSEALAACTPPFFDEKTTSFVLPPSDAMCESLKSYLEPYSRLTKAADFTVPDVPLWGRVDPAENAFYYNSVKVVMINTGTMAKHPRPTEGMLFALAHEIGHAVQERGGELAWGYQPGLAGKESDRRSRVIEGQADHIAAELLAKAGLGGTRAAAEGVQQFFTCARIQDEGAKARTHPTSKDRFLAPLKQASLMAPPPALDEAGLAAAFDLARRRGDGTASVTVEGGPRVYKPSLGLEDFDAYGRPKTEGLRTKEVPLDARSAPARADASTFWDRMAVSAEAATAEALDWAWFNNSAVESVALKACGVAEPADFNEAVQFGSAAWMRDTAGAMTARLKGMLAKR
jgi:hypothetical protein